MRPSGRPGSACLLLAVLTLTPGRPLRRRWAVLVAAAVPVAAYVVWLVLSLPGADDALARTLVRATVLGPALVACLVAAFVGATVAHRRTDDREELLATRLVALGIGAAAAGWVLLEVLPRVVSRDPAVSGAVLGLLLVPLLVGSLGDRGDPLPRRRDRAGRASGARAGPRRGPGRACAFVGHRRGASTWPPTSPVGSMLAGGLVGPGPPPRGGRAAAVGCAGWSTATGTSRAAWSPTCAASTRWRAPEEALGETLDLLARRLHLSYAAIEVFGTDGAPAVTPTVGAPRGHAGHRRPRRGRHRPRSAAPGGGPGARPVRSRRPTPPRGRRHPGGRARPGGARSTASSSAPAST